MIDDQYIIDRFFKENNINKKTVYNLNEEELQYLKNRFNDSSCLNETFWRIKLKLYKRPTCEYCGCSLKYQYHKGRFSKTCENTKCKSNNILNQLENNFSDKEVININDNTILEKYKKYILNHKTLNYLKTIYSKKEWDYILNRYKDYDSIKEIFFRIENNIEIRPTCKLCGKRVKFQYISRYKSYNYNTYCSCKCTMNDKDFIEKIENSMIKKYGVKNIQFLEETKIKTKNTNLKRYGVEY